MQFKSLKQAESAEGDMKKQVLYANFRAKSIKSEWDWEKEVVKISGYASTKDKDRYNDVVHPEAFKKTMKTYMTNPMLLLQHDMNKQIWVVTDYEIDETGLNIDADVKYFAGDPELHDKITNWDLKGFSIWFRIRELEFVEEEIDGCECWTLHILELELLEISVVTIPANPYTLMKSLDDMLGKLSPVEVKSEDQEIETPETPETPAEEKPVEVEEEKEEEEPQGEEEEETEEPDTDTPAEEPEEEETPEEDPEIEPETSEEPEEKSIDPETPEKTKFVKSEENDNIDNEESDEAEKPTEIVDTPEGGWTEEPQEESEKWLTLKMLEKLLNPHIESMQKQFNKEKKETEKAFDEKLKANQKWNIEMLEAMYELVESQSKRIKTLTGALETVTSWKWFIYSEDEAKPENTREKALLNVFDKMKKQF